MTGSEDQQTRRVPDVGLASASTAPLTDQTVAIDRASRPVTFPYAIGDPILPGYRLVKLLGRGGFGEVWQADAPGGMSVAIKVLVNVGRREGTREYRALQTVKNIRHAHMVPVFGDVGQVREVAERADHAPAWARPTWPKRGDGSWEIMARQGRNPRSRPPSS